MTFTITDSLANCFGTAEVSLNVYAFPMDAFGSIGFPAKFTVPPTALAAATATANGSGIFALTVPLDTTYNLAAQSVLAPNTWYWNYNHATDGNDVVADTQTGQHVLLGPTTGSAPAILVQAGNGTSPATPTITGFDLRGTVSFGSGSSPAIGNQVRVTFNKAFTAAPVVFVTAGNAATAVLSPFAGTVGTTSFMVGTGVAPTGSQSAGTYAVNYWVVG